MREVLFKNLTSVNGYKKDTFLKEQFEKDGVLAKAERRYFYFIKSVIKLKDDQEMQGWVKEQENCPPAKKRHFYILKEHNNELGEDKLICKVAGTFYAVVGKKIYTIGFLHSFKICFLKAHV